MDNSETDKLFLGIDIGSVSLSYVLISEQQEIRGHGYFFHHGDIFGILRKTLEEVDLARVCQVGYNHRSNEFFSEGVSVNDQVAIIEGVHFQKSDIGSVFIIGGEMFGLVLFDENHQYQKYISNSSCAAGTGAFLDQQAERLGLSGSADLSRLAETFQGEPPKISTRCAVFAKTDLVHCQQQGYSIEAIAAGLCEGLARNIFDTLNKGVKLSPPVAVVGGVSKNPRVVRYLSELVGLPIMIPEHSILTGALGCALIAQGKCNNLPAIPQRSIASLLKGQNREKHYFYPSLTLEKSVFPDFSGNNHYISRNVEVDVYTPCTDKDCIHAYLGIDIGSTSTKAVVMEADSKARILFGLYTRTMGQPIQATQSLLRALREIEEQYRIRFEFRGVGTTGSGRKFIQKVINADLAIDEITTHARAAYALNPEVDTIIEIGGQDSKFTVIKNGHVIFSVMNYVCAAGTGSFIEEQAKRLETSLDEYADRAIGTPSPLTSDRCTVFMERDLTHYLSQGYSRDELLAAALHSVADNYLSKVAHLNKIGNVICFQGATAKNKALVAVLEEKLQKPIFVSKYCHLTGALGVCLLLGEKLILETHFRGIDFYQQSLRVSEQICDYCTNHCKLKRIHVSGGDILWGFLCGRDESDNKRKSTNRSGFDLLSSRRRIFSPLSSPVEKWEQAGDVLPPKLAGKPNPHGSGLSLERLKENLDINMLNLRHRLFAIRQEELQEQKRKTTITIGIPSTLYMLELVPFWEFFFKELGYTVFLSSSKPERLSNGKEIAGAEFCAPISLWHGHIQELNNHADYLFLPQMFKEGEASDLKYYCYYSNFAVALVRNIRMLDIEHKCITPTVDFSTTTIHNVQQIYESLPQELRLLQTPSEIKEAYTRAWYWFTARKEHLNQILQQQMKQSGDVSVVLLGRPYMILDPFMNQNIPQKFNELGVKTFFQDMLPLSVIDAEGVAREYITWNHWKYGSFILRATENIANAKGLYPVYISAFKCSPDSFVINYFKEIMDAYQKPYLILQIDEHGSDIGYGTRVEAAVETFRNHLENGSTVHPKEYPLDNLRTSLKQNHMLVPNFDPLSCDLICAAFEHAGYKSHLIEETPTTVVSSLRLNDGQCLPISSIIQGAVETIQKYHLRPENTEIFMNAIADVACNFPQYPLMAKRLLEQWGGGFERVRIFATEYSMIGLPVEVIYDVYCSYLLGGLIRKIGCKLRPYEMTAGQVDQLIDHARSRLHDCIARGESKEVVFAEIVADFARIPLQKGDNRKPKVAIIGDLFVRDNDVFNQQLIAELESLGAEIVTAPFTYTVRLSAERYNYALSKDGHYLPLLPRKLLSEVAEKLENRYYQIAGALLDEALPTFDESIFKTPEQYKLSLEHVGETNQNLLMIFSLLKQYPDLRLFVHVNPIFCCPGLVSEAIFKTVEKDIGIPIVSITYDGTLANKNAILAPYMHYISNPPGRRGDDHFTTVQ